MVVRGVTCRNIPATAGLCAILSSFLRIGRPTLPGVFQLCSPDQRQLKSPRLSTCHAFLPIGSVYALSRDSLCVAGYFTPTMYILQILKKESSLHEHANVCMSGITPLWRRDLEHPAHVDSPSQPRSYIESADDTGGYGRQQQHWEQIQRSIDSPPAGHAVNNSGHSSELEMFASTV